MPARQPVIGITGNYSKRNGRYYLASRQAYQKAVEMVGGIPLILPPLVHYGSPEQAEIPEDVRTVAQAWLHRLDGLLLTGGEDVDPRFYGQERRYPNLEVNLARDQIELALARAAVAQDLPVFAICRGVQVLNVALGGTLIQDIPSEVPRHLSHRQKAPRHQATHTLTAEPDTRLVEAVGARRFATNTFHHQAIREPAARLVITARSEDGIIEGVEHTAKQFVVGVQFHPEEMVETDQAMLRLFQAFVAACQHRR